MKILLDANISRKLTNALMPIFDECNHVDLTGLDAPAEDIAIWNYALKHGYTIITKDSDFVDLLELKGFPPKIVLLKTGNNSSKALMDLLIRIKPEIEDLEKSNYGLLEVINKKNIE